MLDTVIVGAGPYGLSLSAHLRFAGVSFRIFGGPMKSLHSRQSAAAPAVHALNAAKNESGSAL